MKTRAGLIEQAKDELHVEAQAGLTLYERADAAEDSVIVGGFARLRRVFRGHAGLLAFLDGWERDWQRADAAADRQAAATLAEVIRLNLERNALESNQATPTAIGAA